MIRLSYYKTNSAADHMEVYAKREAFMTLKTTKKILDPNHLAGSSTLLKLRAALWVKITVEWINNRLHDITKLVQWTNTQAVLQWFSNVTTKDDKTCTSVTKCCIVGYGVYALWDLWDIYIVHLLYEYVILYSDKVIYLSLYIKSNVEHFTFEQHG